MACGFRTSSLFPPSPYKALAFSFNHTLFLALILILPAHQHITMHKKSSSPSPSSSSSSCSSAPDHSTYESKPPSRSESPRDRREELRRIRNVQSAKRTKDRLKNEHRWMEIQTLENEDRIRLLERRIDILTAELERPSPSSSSVRPPLCSPPPNTERPAWFGAPF